MADKSRRARPPHAPHGHAHGGKPSDREGAARLAGMTGSATPAPAGNVEPECGPGEHSSRAPRRSPVSDEAFERAASLFRVVGDVARLRLLDRLAESEWCVTELAEAAGVGLSTVSQQLRVLRAERIVARRRDGKHIYYRLADAHVRHLVESAIEHASEDDDADDSF